MSTGKQGQNPAVYRLDVLSQLAFTQNALRFPDKITIVRSLTHTTIKTHSVLFFKKKKKRAACARIYPLGEPKSRDKIC